MELKELVGLNTLDAVDFTNEPFEAWDGNEDCQVCRFRLNGTTYVAAEDPSDGYRSCMRDLSVHKGATLSNVFPPVQVVCRHRDRGAWDEDDVLEVYDLITGKLILEVGTTNVDDYYPSFVASFSPENMATNRAD